jgi:hypothetical protein
MPVGRIKRRFKHSALPVFRPVEDARFRPVKCTPQFCTRLTAFRNRNMRTNASAVTATMMPANAFHSVSRKLP